MNNYSDSDILTEGAGPESMDRQRLADIIEAISVIEEAAQLGIEEVIDGKRQAILELADEYGVDNVRVFGSVARGQASADSGLDLLGTFGPASDCG